MKEDEDFIEDLYSFFEEYTELTNNRIQIVQYENVFELTIPEFLIDELNLIEEMLHWNPEPIFEESNLVSDILHRHEHHYRFTYESMHSLTAVIFHIYPNRLNPNRNQPEREINNIDDLPF